MSNNATLQVDETFTVGKLDLRDNTAKVILKKDGLGGTNEIKATEVDNQGTITLEEKTKITVNGAADSNLGNITLDGDSSITNSSDGSVIISKLTGAKTVTLTNSASGTLEVSDYDDSAVPSIVAAANNITLAGGTIDNLTVEDGATVTITDAMTVNGDVTIKSGGKLIIEKTITVKGNIDNAGTLDTDAAGAKIIMTGAAASFTGNGSTISDFEYAPTSSGTGLTIADTNTFTKFSCAGEATIKIDSATTMTKAYIAGDVTVNVGANLTGTTLYIQKPGNDLTSNWTTKFTGSGTVSFGGIDFNRASSTSGVIGTLEVDCPMTCSGTVYTHSGTTLVIDNGASLKTNELTHSATNSTPKSQITVNGTLTASGTIGTIDLQGYNNDGCNALKVGSSGKVIADKLTWSKAGVSYSNGDNALDNAGTITLSGDLNAKGPVVNSGTIKSTGGDLTFDDDLTNSGTLNISGKITATGASAKFTGGGITVSDFVYNPTSSSGTGLTIADANTFTKFTCASEGKINVGTGAVTVDELVMAANASVNNSSTGSIGITKLTGKKTATLNSGSDDRITVGGYGTGTDVPSIAIAEDSKSVSLAGGTIGTLSVGSGATAAITGDLEVTGATTNKGTINADANDITFNGVVTSGADAKITTTTGNITTNADTASALGTIQTTSGTLQNTGSGEVTVTKLSAGAATSVTNTAGGSITLENIASSSATTLSGAINVTAYADELPLIIVAPTGTSANNVSIGAGKPASLTINASGKATIAGDIETSGGISNSGTLDASAAKITMTGATAAFTGNATTTVSDFVYAPTAASASLAVSGANTFTNFTCQKGGATINVSGAQTINGDLTLKGASGSLLTIDGSGSLAITASQSKQGEFLSVGWDNVLISGTGKYIAEKSVAASAPLYGQKNNWIILNSAMEFVWTGATDDKWEDASNWNYNMVPGKAAADGVPSTVGYNVTIPDTINKPKVSGTTTYSVGDLTLEASAILTLSDTGNVAVAATGTLTNNGTIVYSSTGRITDGTNFINDDAQGTVEFTSGATNLSEVSYHDLKITGSGTYTAATALTVNGNLDIASGATVTLTGTGANALTVNGNITNAGTLTTNREKAVGAVVVRNNLTQTAGTLILNALAVTNKLTISGGDAYFNASDDKDNGTATSAGTVELSTTGGSVSLGNNGKDTFTVTTGALEFPSSLGDLELCGTITANTNPGITLSKDATLKGQVVFDSDTKLGANVSLILADAHTAMQTATTNKKLNCAGYTLTLKNASLKNEKQVTNGKIKFIETDAYERKQEFWPYTGATTIYESVTIEKNNVINPGSLEIKRALKATDFTVTKNGTLTADADVTVDNLTITQNTTATFKGLVTVNTAYSDTGDAGNINFTKGCAFTPATTFNTTETVTLNGSTTACAFTNGMTHTAGTTTLNGSLTSTNSDITLGDTILNDTEGASDTTIDAGSGAVTINGTLNGAKAFASNGTGTVTFAGAVGATTVPTTITVEGPTTITAPSVKTSDLQNYKGNLTFGADCALTGTVQADANIASTAALDASAAKITMTGASPTFTGNNANVADFVYEPTDTTGTGLNVADGNTFTNFACSTPSAKVTLSGANTIGTLSMTSGGGTLTVNAAQDVTTLKLEGTGEDPNLLTVAGNGSIAIADQHAGKHLKINRDQVKITGGYYIADNSEFASASATDPKYGQHNGWIVMNPDLTFNWKGTAGTDWGNASNWDCGLIPGTDQPINGHTFATSVVSTMGYPVTIATKANQPVTSDTPYSVGQLTIDDATATLTLASADVSIATIPSVCPGATGELINKGTIKYSDAGRIKKGGAFHNDTANGGTVDFNGSVAASDLASVQYYNLIVSGSGAFSSAADKTLKVLNDLTQSAGTLTTNGAVDVTNALAVSGGSAYFNAATKAKSAVFTTAGTVSLGDAAGDTFATTDALNLSDQPAAGTLKLSGTITAGGGITLSHDATLNADTTFASATTLSAAVTLSGEHKVTTSGALTTSSTNTLTLQDASLENTGSVNGGNIIFTGTSGQTFTPSGSVYASVKVNKTSGEFTIDQTLSATELAVTQNGTLTTSAAVTADKLTITQNTTATFNDLVTVNSTYTDAITAGDIKFNAGCSFTGAALTTFNTTGKVTLDGHNGNSCNFTNGVIHTAGNTELYGSLTTTNSDITLGATTLAADTTINAGTGTITLGAVVGAYILTVSANGTLKPAGDISASKVTMTGDAPKLTGSGKTITNFVYAPSVTTGTGLAISGANTFTNFTCQTGGATLNVSDSQTVGTLALKGADGSSLKVTGNGSLNITSNQSGDYLTVALAGPKICNDSGEIYYSAKNSTFDGDPYYGQHNHWIILNKAMVFKWLGDDSEDWGTASNWNYKMVPGLASTIGGVSTQGYPVVISNSPAKTYMPKTAATPYSVGQLTIADNTATLTLANSDISLATITDVSATADGSLTNAGTIFYSSTGRIKKGGAFHNDTANGGTVDFNGSVAASDLASVQYYNLIVSGSGAFSSAADKTLKVLNDLTQSAGTLTTNGAVDVTNALAVSGGSAYFNAATKAKSAVFTTAGTVSLGDAAGDTFATTDALNLSDQPAAGTLKLSGTITAGGGITLSHDATLNADATFASATSLSAAVTLSGEHKVTTSGALTTSAVNTLTLNNASLTNTGTVTDGNIIFTSDASVAQTFVPSTSEYKNIKIDKNTNSSLTVSGALKTEKIDIEKCHASNFNGLVTVSVEYTDAATAGNIVFTKGCSFTGAALTTFNTTGKVTLDGHNGNSCNFTNGVIHTAGNTELYGALNTTNSDITLGTTTLAADTTIDAGTGAVKINGTLNGANAFASNGSGLLTFAGAVGATSNLTTITVAGPTNVTAPSVTTTGLQHYKGNLTFGANCAVTGVVQAAAGIITSGSAKATFNNNVWLYTGTATASLGGASGSIAIKENLYFVGESKNTSVDSNVTAKNVLLLHGTVDIAAGGVLASSSGDVILLGPSYDIDDDKDKTGDPASHTPGLFAYKPAGSFARKCAVSYTGDFPGINPTVCPDGSTPISASWSGAVTTNTGAKILAGQNFYANGLSSLGSDGGAWTLLLKGNESQSSAFAEIYNSTVKSCTASPIDGSSTVYVAAAENNTVSGCSDNIVTSRPVIAQAYTVYDDVIYVTFKDSINGNPVAIENSGNEISAAAAQISYSGGKFVSTWKDADCKTASTNGAGDLSSFYIKAESTWNTDAYEISKGADESSDRSGAQKTAIPCINLPKTLDSLYETLRDSAKNRIAHYYSGHASGAAPDTSAVNDAPGKTFTKVADKCAPVLIKVLTGQETHQDPASQKEYDAHNFIEFVYSEPVDISGGTTSVADSDVNIHAAADLGATTNNASGITFAGLATTAGGKIDAALKTGSGSPHALYRNFPRTAGAAPGDQAARVRVSIAGFVDGTFSVDGNSFNNWTGYISSATTPSGKIDRINNANIKDKSPAKNSLDTVSTDGHALPTLYVNASETDLNGTWDTTPPSFAPVRINGTSTWSVPAYDGSQEFEFVGASYGTGTLSAIEVHWFDNQPQYDETLQWFSRAGWGTATAGGKEYSSITSYAADVRGGSRPDTGSGGVNVTAGGIRYSSIYNANNAFEYAIYGSESYTGFTKQIKGGAESSLFTYGGADSAGVTTHTTGAEDGLYCKLLLDNTLLQPNTTFSMTFDSNTCFITDLAGNRIQCGKIKMKSIDRTPPEFLMSAVPLGTDKMLLIFSKALNIDTLALYKDSNTHDNVSALEYIPKALEFKTISGGVVTQIEVEDVPAKCVFRNNKATGLILTLSKNAVLDNVTGGIFINAKKSDTYKYDPLSGIDNSSITYIQDAIGNYVVADSKHAFSDFAVNAVNPQYAYDNSLTDGGDATSYGLYQEGSWAVRDWNAEQKNYGTLSANKEIIMQTSLYDGSKQLPSGQKISAVFDSAPDIGSVSTKINETTGFAWRIWHPNLTDDVFTSLAPINNIPQFSVEGESNDSGVAFDISKERSSNNWKSGDQVSFLFKMGDYTVDHFADGRNFPLYAVRLKDPADITSLDLWSFRIKTTNLQRGGVTILNNVIDLNNGEHTVVQVDMKESGNLNVMVMTLDGNIVTYLRHGHTDAGTHYYNWNGTNNGGSKVARGLYFVRVIGPGIDETRKVMCVK